MHIKYLPRGGQTTCTILAWRHDTRAVRRLIFLRRAWLCRPEKMSQVFFNPALPGAALVMSLPARTPGFQPPLSLTLYNFYP